MAIQIAAVVAVIKAIGDVAGAINNVLALAKNVEAFIGGAEPDPTQQRLDELFAVTMQARQEQLNAAQRILAAVSDLDQTIFRERMADKLGDCDQAILALDTWRRTRVDGSRLDALNESAGALSDLLEYVRSSVYPGPSLLVPIAQALPSRLLILKSADPGFVRSSVAREPIEEAIRFIRSTVNEIETAILDANRVIVNRSTYRQVRIIPREEGGGREVVTITRIRVTYHNLLGTASFERSASFEFELDSADDFQSAAQAAADAVRSRGVAEDLQSAKVAEFRGIADSAERALIVSEGLLISRDVFQRELTPIQRAWFINRRQRADFRDTALEFAATLANQVEDKASSEIRVQTVASRLLNRTLNQNEEAALSQVADSFGGQAALNLLLGELATVPNAAE